ncbi:MAG: adenine phosphoribosyltransferase [Ignavibacteria bacterium]|nr:adenine phosphoribosyltransferase [Ignavibacteria bacterium]
MVNEHSGIHPLAASIRNIPDFPKPGIVFRDITTLWKDPSAFREVVEIFVRRYRGAGIEKIVCVESRGFVFGGALAQELGVGLVPVRKKGKLPSKTIRAQYDLEYGTDTIEIHADAITRGEKILIHDDLLATGGTIQATCELVEQLGGTIVEIAFLMELSFLKGRDRLKGKEIFSIIRYDHE